MLIALMTIVAPHLRRRVEVEQQATDAPGMGLTVGVVILMTPGMRRAMRYREENRLLVQHSVS